MFSLGMGVKGGEFARGFFTPSLLVVAMRRVLHVGPCDTPGGMATVMHTLAEFPPEGWQADLLASHAPGGLWAKWRAYRKARKELIRRCRLPSERPDIVHVHTAADWSWRRKRRFALIANEAGCNIIIHIHSGQFDTWLESPHSSQSSKMRAVLQKTNAKTIVLSEWWKERLHPLIGSTEIVHNPVDKTFVASNRSRNKNHILLLGRDDPVKGHAFGIKVCQHIRETGLDLRVTMSGITSSPYSWLEARGWMSDEEKLRLLQTASLLIVPSEFEGEPLVVLEAISCGLPVLTSDRLHSLPSSIEVAPFKDEGAWASKIIQLLQQPTDPLLLMEHSKQYNIETISNKWREVYQGLLDQ